MSNSTDNPQSEERIDVRVAVGRLWARRWWIYGSIIFFTGLSIAAAFLIEPVYRSTCVLVPVDSERQGLSSALSGAVGSLGGLASLAGLNVGPRSQQTEEALAVLASREFTEAFIRDNNLMPKLFEHKWDARANTWKSGIKLPTPYKAFRLFDKSIRTVSQDKKTGLVTLQIDWRDPGEAAAWANELVRRLNAEMRGRAIEQSTASLGYLENELNKTTEIGTRDAINRLIETQIRLRMLANVTQEYAFRVVDRAMPADRDNPVWPKKSMLTASGFVVGALLGIAAVLIAEWLSALREAGVPDSMRPRGHVARTHPASVLEGKDATIQHSH